MKKQVVSYALAAVLVSTIAVPAHGADIAKGQARSGACAGCHGADGIGLSGEFPNLAGQKAPYLAKQLEAFRSGARVDPAMKVIAATLTDADIENLAAYFASLAPLGVAPPPAAAAAATRGADKTQFPETTFITMKKSGTVEEFPSERTWQGGPNMLYDALTPDARLLLATSPSENTVHVFDTGTGQQLAVVAVGKAPKGVKVTPNGRFAYVSNQGSAEVSVVDLRTFQIVESIKVEEAPHNVRFTRDGKLAYVTLQGGAGLGVIDTETRKMIRVIPVPGITGPHNLDLSADEKTAYVRDFVHNVAVLDLPSGTVKKVIRVGNGHGGIDVAPNGRFVATAAIGDDHISVIDTDTLAVKDIPVGNGPHGVRASLDSRWIYVSVTKDNTVAVINADTMTVEKKIAVGEFPFWVAVHGNP